MSLSIKIRPRPSLRLALLAGVFAACGGPAQPGDNGKVCFRTDECKIGLVCAPIAQSGEKVCTADISGIVPEPRDYPVGGAGGGTSE